MGNMLSCWAEEPAETSSTCVPNKKTATAAHDFTVTSFALLKGMGAGEFVGSRTFRVGGHRWQIRFFPDGAADGRQHAAGHASAYLCLRGGAPAGGVHARFTLSLRVDGESKPSVSRCGAHTFRPWDALTCGFADFVDGKSELLLHDRFTIRCDLTVIEKPSIV